MQLAMHIALVSLGLLYLSIPVARSARLVDVPGGRKEHLGEIPLAGGIALFATLSYGVLILHIDLFTPNMLLVALIPFLIGVFDDRVHINPWLRLVIHYGCGIVMATYGGIAIHNVGNLLAMGDIPLLYMTIPLTALSVAGLCNACNMIDGIDGLAASLVLVPLSILLLLASADQHPMADILVVIITPLLIFLCFNLTPDSRLLPRIFLGDAGSVTLGFLLTAALVYSSQGETTLILPVTALWLVTVPLMDMLATMLRRAKQGRNPMKADNSHLHHLLMGLGLGRHCTLAVLILYSALCACIGLWLERVPESLSLLAYFGLFAAHCIFVIKASAHRLVNGSHITSDN